MRSAAYRVAKWLWDGADEAPFGPPGPERGIKWFLAWHLYHWSIKKRTGKP